ncbi:hypothetical protein [Paenibacillus alginolyticus]|uniref:Uncharacterized protein n=1 Tax=Paenibacillus alginolyticus TaxID=59839 RepID=A0ABT4GPX8_9BACL|nr:hypothetical protein [Paenibacillus alginolyticus]MCY9698273.1 hypothetical protein [Paenibacillus alginolyticus]MEC0148973.1 hypothetical protein [Paenibacillus alginolyticus]
MRIDGKHTCIDCSREFEWMSLVAQPMNAARYKVATIDKPQARVVEKREGTYFINIFCPQCNRLNSFEHEE